MDYSTSSLGSAKAAIQVLSHPSSELAGPAVVLQNSKGTRYIFGHIVEGFQRYLNQHKQKTSKLKHIFLSGPLDWRTLGGLPGFLLTCNDQGAKSVHIHSADKRLQNCIRSWRHFIFHETLNLQNISSGKEVFCDDFIAVETVQLTRSRPVQMTASNYIIQILPSRGRFLVEVAKKLGVPRGRMYTQLSQGNSVTLEDGRIVHPEQVLEQSPVPPRVIILDIPDDSFVSEVADFSWDKDLTSNGKRKLGEELPRASQSTEVQIKVIYHFLGENVDLDRYLLMIKSKFPADCYHFVSHPNYTPNNVVLESAASLTKGLSAILPEYFGTPYSRESLKPFPELKDVNMYMLYSLDGMFLQNKLKYLPITNDGDDLLSRKNNKVKGLTTATSSRKAPLDLTIYNFPQEPEVVTLGTGSSQPSKYRNVVSTIVRISKSLSVMYDCGEGTVGSMKRLYGPSFGQRISEIKILYISHMHADHHLGAVSLIQEWIKYHEKYGGANQEINNNGEESGDKSSTKQKLLVVGPGMMKKFLDEWALMDPCLDMSRVEFLDIENYITGRGYYNSQSSKGRNVIQGSCIDKAALQHIYGIQSLVACRAFHCEYSYCVVITINGFKVSYSGDTRPTAFFSRIGKGSNLLIHEATHEDDLLKEAQLKRHSTVSEAIKVARDMNAKNIVLTHFSQRYPKIPDIKALGNKDSQDIIIAFDGMHVKLSQFRLQAERMTELENLFAEENEWIQEEEKNEK